MSCDNNRKYFFNHLAAQFPGVNAIQLERDFQSQKNLQPPRSFSVMSRYEAKVRALFGKMQSVGLKPPVHTKSGLPRSAGTIVAYARIYDYLDSAKLLDKISGDATSQAQKKWVGREDAPIPLDDWATVCDERGRYKGLDRWGFDDAGVHAISGRGRGGYDANGYDAQGFNRYGYNANGYDRDGFNKHGVNSHGVSRQGLNIYGYTTSPSGDNPAGTDAEGFDIDGIGPDGYDRGGFDRYGRDRNGVSHFAPDENGIYPDGLPEDATGLMPDGLDRWGYKKSGWLDPTYANMRRVESIVDKDGYSYLTGLDGNGCNRTGYNTMGWRMDKVHQYSDFWTQALNSWCIDGRNRLGQDKDGFLPTGFNLEGLDRNGKPRRVFVKGQEVKKPKYNRDGLAEDGLDRWGYGADMLTAPDKDGYKYNLLGWRYDPATQRCHSLQTPGVSMLHQDYRIDVAAPGKGIRHPFFPANSTVYAIEMPRNDEAERDTDPDSPPRTPLTPGQEIRFGRFATLESRWLSSETRAALNPKATYKGALLRCPMCGQFTGAMPHACQTFQSHYGLRFYPGGAITRADFGLIVHVAPNGDYETLKKEGQIDKTARYPHGFDSSGYDEDGYLRNGYNRYGYDRDGYDRNGYDRNGFNRWGSKFVPKLSTAAKSAEADGIDLLSNDDLVALYSRVATGLVGKPRQVILRTGGGFATDMNGKIYADPYPLGDKARPAENALVTRAGIYHELGHEVFTRPDIWAQVLEIAHGTQDIGLSEQARKLLPSIYNIVEDGRMERMVSATYPGVREILAASCRLSPRWDEKVGKGVPIEREIEGALLYTGLPFFSVSDEVREKMSPKGRDVFEKLEPLVARAVRQTNPEDAFDVAVQIAERLASLQPLRPEQFTPPQPPETTLQTPARTTPPKSKKQPDSGSQRGQGQSKDEDQSGGRQRGQGQGEDEDQSDGRQRGQGQGEDEDQSGAGRQRGQGQSKDEDQSGAGRQRGQGQSKDEDQSGAGRQRGQGQGEDEDQSGAGRQRGQGQGEDDQQGDDGDAFGEDEDQFGAGRQRGQGQGEDDQQGDDGDAFGEDEDQSGAGRQRGQGQGEDDQQGDDGDAFGEDEDQSGAGRYGQGSDIYDEDVEDWAMSDDDLESVLGRVERETAMSISAGIQRRAKPRALGKFLHKTASEFGEQRRFVQHGQLTFAAIHRARGDEDIEAQLQARRSQHKAIATRLAVQLRAIRQQAEQRLKRQSDGKLDRRQMVNAVKGAQDVYQRTRQMPQTSMAVSIAIDLSGSMLNHVLDKSLYDATMVLCDTLESLEMPHEVLAFGSRDNTAQIKAMSEDHVSPNAAALLASKTLGGTHMSDAAGMGSNSLLACEEHNKLFISMTDGALEDQSKVVETLEQARKDGVIPFGIFLGANPPTQNMDALYGRGGWTHITSLDDMPKKVGQRLAIIFNSLKPVS